MKKFLSLLVLFVSPLFAQAANEVHAVVRIPSHGASATVIDTGPGYTWVLGCGHAYEGKDRNKPMVFDIPTATQKPSKQVGNKLVKLDYENDLSLVLINDGPLDYVCQVAWVGWHEWNDNILACGYDQMKSCVKAPAHILSEEGTTFYTRERPVPGRSGGGLIDTDKGVLIGVCQGFETEYKRRGMYVSLKTIQRFLQQPQQAPQLPLQRLLWQPKGQGLPCPGGS